MLHIARLRYNSTFVFSIKIEQCLYCNMNGNLALTNGRIFTEYDSWDDRALLIADGFIVDVVPADAIPEGYTQVNAQGRTICPGLIDLQIYGSGDDLFSAELSKESLHRIDQRLLKQGCTSWMPTLATNTLAVFKEAIAVFQDAQSPSPWVCTWKVPFEPRKMRCPSCRIDYSSRCRTLD